MVAAKHPSARQRRNKTVGPRTLHAVHDVGAPPLPALMVTTTTGEGDDKRVETALTAWHDMTTAWWRDVWASPMAPEYDASDIHGLYLLARLVDMAWRTTSDTALKEAMVEVRLQRPSFGLTPLDRRRLQWEIERGEEAKDKGAKAEPERAKRKRKPTAVADPRSILEA